MDLPPFASKLFIGLKYSECLRDFWKIECEIELKDSLLKGYHPSVWQEIKRSQQYAKIGK